MWQGVGVCGFLLFAAISVTQGFDVGVRKTKCNLDASLGDINDPCKSLYEGVCQGKYCACPPGTHEDKNLRRCTPGEAPRTSAGGGDLFDLPLDYEPNKPAPAPAPAPQPRPQPPQSGYNPNQPQPGYIPNQPQPGYNPNQPQPPYNPNQPNYNPNQPGYRPDQPGRHGPTKGGGGNDVGEKAGGGVGGALGLLLIGGLIYFCCCRGGKHKEVMNRFQGLPFMRGARGQAPGGAVQMQQSAPVQQDANFASQHTYIPPGGQVPPDQYPPPQQPYPAGYPADGQQPPPYTQQYQPNAPVPQ